MARYVTLENLIGKLPLAHLTDAFDDDRDGAVDSEAVAAALEAACVDVESYLEGRYEIPFTTVPAVVSKAAPLFAIETTFNRRQKTIPETLAAQIKDVRAQLTAIGAGDEPLSPEVTSPTGGVGSAITECTSINEALA